MNLRARFVSYASIALTLLLAATVCGADEAPSDPASPLRPGLWAFQFRIANNFNLASFEGTAVSLKYQSTERSAWRVGVESRLDDLQSDRANTIADTLFSRDSLDRTGYDFGIDLQYLRYARPEAPVLFFFGGGPSYRTQGTTSEIESSQTGSATERRKSENSEWAIGATMLAGVEWFATSQISLHAEYGLEFMYESTHDETSYEVPDRRGTEDSDGFSLGPRAVLFGLSVYF